MRRFDKVGWRQTLLNTWNIQDSEGDFCSSSRVHRWEQFLLSGAYTNVTTTMDNITKTIGVRNLIIAFILLSCGLLLCGMMFVMEHCLQLHLASCSSIRPLRLLCPSRFGEYHPTCKLQACCVCLVWFALSSASNSALMHKLTQFRCIVHKSVFTLLRVIYWEI